MSRRQIVPSGLCRWVFSSPDDVRRFWLHTREVPGRTNGRTSKQYERYYLALYFLALAHHQLLSYPIEVVESESPDFIVKHESDETTGLEVTRATDQDVQRWLSRAAKEHPAGSATMPNLLGYAADQLEDEWCGSVRKVIEKKVAELSRYKGAAIHDLLVADDTRAGAGDRRKVVSLLSTWARELKRREPKLGKISVVASLDVLYDIGGESRIFPYIDWSALETDDLGQSESFSQRAELAARVTVERAIREPSQRHVPSDEIPVPGYYIDMSGRIVRRTSEGRRFEVTIEEDGSEVIVKELPSE